MLFNQAPIFTHPLLYLDPGSGSVLIQLVLAALLGIGITVKLYWSKIKTLFGGNRTEMRGVAEEEDDK